MSHDETQPNSSGPILPIASERVPWTDSLDLPRFQARYRHLTQALLGSTYKIGVAIEELFPGCQSAPFHYHIFEEEHVLILEGAVTLRLGDARYPMKAADYVCFPAGQKAGHCLINESDKICRYVLVGERNPNEICVYPDSNKIMLRALGRAVFDKGATRNYWAGEDTGLPEGMLPPPSPVIDEPVVPKPPIAIADVEIEETKVGSNFAGTAQHLTFAAVGGKGYRVGMMIESPAPGKRLCPLHYHMLEEEHALILEGEATLLLGSERHVMKPFDYVCFPAGRKIGHSFLNSGNGPLRYLMIGARDPNEVCVYPQSNKLAVDALKSADSIFDMAATRQYWDGEETG
jgi:uncharacterized cupin superfamily protein